MEFQCSTRPNHFFFYRFLITHHHHHHHHHTSDGWACEFSARHSCLIECAICIAFFFRCLGQRRNAKHVHEPINKMKWWIAVRTHKKNHIYCTLCVHSSCNGSHYLWQRGDDKDADNLFASSRAYLIKFPFWNFSTTINAFHAHQKRPTNRRERKKNERIEHQSIESSQESTTHFPCSSSPCCVRHNASLTTK